MVFLKVRNISVFDGDAPSPNKTAIEEAYISFFSHASQRCQSPLMQYRNNLCYYIVTRNQVTVKSEMNYTLHD